MSKVSYLFESKKGIVKIYVHFSIAIEIFRLARKRHLTVNQLLQFWVDREDQSSESNDLPHG